MKLPPALTHVRVVRSGGRRLGLWVPVFLLWPLLFALGIVALAIAALADAILYASGRTYHHYTRLVTGLFALLGEARGTMVRVDGPETDIHIEIR